MVMQDKIKTAKVVMGRAVQVQEHQMMQEREREYNQALDQTMDQQRLQANSWPFFSMFGSLTLLLAAYNSSL